MMKLLGSLTSSFVRKARIVLAEKKIEYTFELDNPWDEKSRVPDANPLGKVPVLVDPALGQPLAESGRSCCGWPSSTTAFCLRRVPAAMRYCSG